jgi:hypothetical protein
VPTLFIILGRAVAYYVVRQPRGVVAMMKNLVAGLVLVAFMIMGWLAFAQKHEGCWRGRSLHTLKPCGSMSTSM